MDNLSSPQVPPTRPARHARTTLSAEVHHRLGHLALDLRVSLADLLREGAILVLRYHERADGLGDPELLPIAPGGGQ